VYALDRHGVRARAFVAAWVLLGLLGALDHGIAEAVLGRRFDLRLPHLQYGHVMFNRNPTAVWVFSYSGADGERHDLADLVALPAPGYKRTRLAMNVAFKPDYLREVCFRHTRRVPGADLTFHVDEYRVDVDREQPARTATLQCTAHGLVDRGASPVSRHAQATRDLPHRLFGALALHSSPR
jgi:hypothetical protein